jgi:hypothetical protein
VKFSLLGHSAVIITLVMEAVRSSETSVSFNVTTRRYIPEDSKLQMLLYLQVMFNPLKPNDMYVQPALITYNSAL